MKPEDNEMTTNSAIHLIVRGLAGNTSNSWMSALHQIPRLQLSRRDTSAAATSSSRPAGAAPRATERGGPRYADSRGWSPSGACSPVPSPLKKRPPPSVGGSPSPRPRPPSFKTAPTGSSARLRTAAGCSPRSSPARAPRRRQGGKRRSWPCKGVPPSPWPLQELGPSSATGVVAPMV